MKFLRTFLLAALLVIFSCKKENTNRWDVALKSPGQPVRLHDLSAEFYDPAVPLEVFKQKYPWFQGSVSDEDFAVRKADPAERKIYTEALAKIDQKKLSGELSDLFARIQQYFPAFRQPKVFIFSSALQMAKEPVFYIPAENFLFIDITGFMGLKNPEYKGIELYMQKSMSPQNMVPKVAQNIAEYLVPAVPEHQKFIDMMVYSGKIGSFLDAVLPKYPDYLKLNYTREQYEWAKANEANIWNYFVENNLVYSDDQRLSERFIAPGPFSKFYTEIDNESSPQIGAFTGWQICRKFFEENPATPFNSFLKMNASDIFTKSGYKPK